MNANASSFNNDPGLGGDADRSRWDAGLGSGQSADDEAAGPSTGSLLRDLMHEVPALLGKEMALARAEMRENLEEARRGMTAVSGGAVVLAGGYFVLLFAAVYALSNVLEPWLAALIVGAVAATVGYMMLSAGMRRMSSQGLRPDRTINSLREDKDTIQGARHGYH